VSADGAHGTDSFRLGKHPQIDAQFLTVRARQKLLNVCVVLPPYRNSRDEKRPPGRGQFQPTREDYQMIGIGPFVIPSC
jgi:hypothetical protein